MYPKVSRLLILHPGLILCLAALTTLVPFLSKPFNMDDPLFIWAARQIHAHPGNPYGFEVNWYGSVSSMAEVTKNPPLACYYLAAGAGLLGWSEPALHGIFLLPALAVILGTHRLARHFCNQPALAALITLITPVFLVSGTTVMCDVLMLSFWVWAVLFWLEGIQSENLPRLLGAGALIALAALTKYYGACLIPLLACHGLFIKRRLGRWSGALLIPVLTLLAFHLYTRNLYGRTLLSDAAGYAAFPNDLFAFLTVKAGGCLTALAFVGGGLAAATYFLPLLWRAKHLAIIVTASVLLAFLILREGAGLKNYGPISGSSRLLIEFQIVLWAIGGVSVLTLAISDYLRRRDAESWLLALWVLGTFLFAALFNWTINGRTILPMVPAVGILLVRRLEHLGFTNYARWPRGIFICLIGGALTALFVTRADFLLASAVRESARQTFFKHAQGVARFWYQGHWGFQYYMDALGASALDAEHTLLKRGDLVATPLNNANLSPLGPDLVVLREMITVPGPGWLTTMTGEVGAGFYASLRGPLPFAFGLIPPERVAVCVVDPLIPPTASPR